MPSAQLVDATWLKPLLISDASRGGLPWPPGTLMHATSAMPLQRERSGALKKRGGAVLWAPTPHSCLTLPHDVALHSRRNYCGIVVVGPFVFSRVLLFTCLLRFEPLRQRRQPHVQAAYLRRWSP